MVKCDSFKKYMDVILLGISSLLCYVFLAFYEPSEIETALYFAMGNIIDLTLIFIFASLLAGLVDVYVDKEMITRLFNPNRNDFINYLIATLAGIATPGPVYGIFPIVIVLKKKGARSDFLVSYLTGQTLMGPMRLPLEIYFLGWKFFIYRALITVVIGVLAGFITRPLVHWIDKELDEKISGTKNTSF